MSGCSKTSKVLMTIIGLIFWGCAAALFFIGAWVFRQYRDYSHLTEDLYTLVPATIIIALGLFFFLLGIIGCVGACKEQKCLLGLFFTVVLIIFVGLVTASALGYVYKDDVDVAVRQGLEKAMHQYDNRNKTVYKDQVDFMQKEMKCCGLDNYTDWWTYSTFQKPNLPASCCDQTVPHNKCPNNGTIPAKYGTYYAKGCYTDMKDRFTSHLGVIGGVGAAFAVILVLGMIFSCVLLCRKRSEVPYIGLGESGGMRV